MTRLMSYSMKAENTAMQSSLGSPTASSIFFFFLIVALTLVVTYWAARRTKTSSEFYAAGRSVSALQNGFALAGDSTAEMIAPHVARLRIAFGADREKWAVKFAP